MTTTNNSMPGFFGEEASQLSNIRQVVSQVSGSPIRSPTSQCFLSSIFNILSPVRCVSCGIQLTQGSSPTVKQNYFLQRMTRASCSPDQEQSSNTDGSPSLPVVVLGPKLPVKCLGHGKKQKPAP